MGKYDKISDAKVSKTGQWFRAGKYRVKINAVKEVDSQKNKDFIAIETLVLESDNPEIKVGTERSQVIDMGKVMGFPNLKQFVAAASGVDPMLENVNDMVEAYWKSKDPKKVDRIFGKIVEEMIIGINALQDVEMNLECTEITTTEGNPFTKHVWGVRDLTNDPL